MEELYIGLGDEKSRQCMMAFLNQKISGKFEYLEALCDVNQYYDKELIDLKNVECMVDCGAYDGDSFRSFCCNYEQSVGRPYGGAAFLLEPDKESFSSLQASWLGVGNVVPLNIGAWDKEGILNFEEDSTSGRTVESGAISIAVDSIDHIVEKARGEI